MSLRGFHILFISLAILMSAGCAWWAFANGVAPLFGLACVLAAVALAIYGVFFLKKSKKLIL
jgi:hypothetical protein